MLVEVEMIKMKTIIKAYLVDHMYTTMKEVEKLFWLQMMQKLVTENLVPSGQVIFQNQIYLTSEFLLSQKENASGSPEEIFILMSWLVNSHLELSQGEEGCHGGWEDG